ASEGGVEFVEPNELNESRDVIDRHDRDLTRLVERDAAPRRAPDVRRHRNGPLQARRREWSVVPKGTDLRETGLAIRGRPPPTAVDWQGLAAETWERAVERLRRRRAFAEDVARGHRSLFHGEDRCSRVAIEDEQLSRLRRLQDDVDPPPIADDRRERGRRR